MARPDKAAAVAELTKKFSSSSGAVLTEYRGLTVKALKDLRRSLGDDATYAVSKNTLTTIAARQAGVPGVEPLLSGPTAIAFIEGDAVAVAKGLRDFARANPLLIIKGGVLDGRSMTADEFRRLADLESREVLLAKAVGAMQGVLQQAVSLVAAPLAQTARLLAALEQAASEDPALIAGSGAPAESTDPELDTQLDTAAPPVDTETVPVAEVDTQLDTQLDTAAPPAVDTQLDTQLDAAAPPAVDTEAAPAAEAAAAAAPQAEESVETTAAPAADEN